MSASLLGCGDDGSGGGGGMGGGSGTASSASVASQTSATSVTGTSATSASIASSSTGMTGPPCEVEGVSGACIDVHTCLGDVVPISGHCDGPTEIQCCIPAGILPCDPASAPLPNQGLVEPPGDPGCPGGMASLGSFCIDRYEASLVDEAGDSLSPFHNPGAIVAYAVSIPGAVPQAYVSGDQAADACASAGKRLCTDAEWLDACRGPGELTYPYGDTLALGTCNDHRDVHPAVELFMTDDPIIYSMLDDACLDQLASSLAPSGTFPGCVTASGLFDMVGNLHEWTSNPAGTFRGGFYVDTAINGPGCLYATTAHDTAHWDYSTGFRCCAERLP